MLYIYNTFYGCIQATPLRIQAFLFAANSKFEVCSSLVTSRHLKTLRNLSLIYLTRRGVDFFLNPRKSIFSFFS